MMRKTFQTAAVAALIILAAFTGNRGSTTRGRAAACTGSISGATTGTYTCTPVSAFWAKSNNLGGVAINASGGPKLTIEFGFPGTPTVRTYTNTDAGALSVVNVLAGTAVWLASAGKAKNQGSYSLKLSSVTAATSPTDGNKIYTVHGTLTATLTPMAGSTATGNATLNFTF